MSQDIRRSPIKRNIMKAYSEEEGAYYKQLNSNDKRIIINNELLVSERDHEIKPLRFRILTAGFKPAEAYQLIKFIKVAEGTDDTAAKMRQYLDFVCKIPSYQSVPFQHLDLNNVINVLDANVFGQARTKRALMRVVAQWVTNPGSKGMCIGLTGSFGTGKTLIVSELAKAMKMPMALVGLGGMTDSAAIVGHEYTYIGAQPGLIARAIAREKSNNLIFLFDELDKVSKSERADDISNVLVHLTDETQNTRFNDRYVGDIDIDVSKSLMVFTFNDMFQVPPVLLDRMTIIEVDNYSIQDKISIATKHLVPDALKAFALTNHACAETIRSEEFLRTAVINTAEDKGVRNLKRSIRAVCAEVNLRRALDDIDVNLSEKELLDILIAETASTRKNTATHLSMYS